MGTGTPNAICRRHDGFSDGVTESLLVGGILRGTDAISFDLGGRYGRADGQHAEELRAGLTWAFEPW